MGFICTMVLTLLVATFILFIIFLAVSDCDLTLKSKNIDAKYFKGKVVWITGASSGIGKALAIALAPLGVKLILSSRKKESLNEVKTILISSMKKKGHTKNNPLLNDEQIIILPLDLEKLESLPEKCETAMEAFGKVDILINNGGISTRYLAENGDFKIDQKLTTIDYLGQVACTKGVLQKMIDQRSGHIVNVSSIAGKMGAPLRTSYCGAKWALIGYMDALRTEVTTHGIHVTNVCPGSVQTEVSKNALRADGSSFGVTDPNIGSGILVERCAELMLVAISNQLHEVWIAKGKELLMTYLHQYAPTVGKSIMIKFANASIRQTLSKKKK